MPSEPDGGLVLRPGNRADLPTVADLHLRAREAAVPAMPPVATDADGVRAHVELWDLATHELWLAEDGAGPCGYAMVHEDWLHSLYVDPARQGGGIGGALLDVAKSLRPRGFCLYVFESNFPARGFYARRGLVELERTDGSGNLERSPDLRMAWPGSDPLGFLRGLIDGVDDELGDLLARRVALTRAVQPHKGETGGGPGSGRDPGRERTVARRLAARAPELGEERLARLVDVIVTESLAAIEDGPPAGRGAGS